MYTHTMYASTFRFTEALERRTIRLNRKRIIDNVQSLTAKEEQKRRLEELERKQTVEEKEVSCDDVCLLPAR